MRKLFGVLILLLAAFPAVAQEVEAAKKDEGLPILAPAGADVTLDMEASNAEMMTLLKVAFGTGGESGSEAATVEVGGVKVNVDDLAKLVKPLRRFHVITYTQSTPSDAVEYHGRLLTRSGMERFAFRVGAYRGMVFRGNGRGGIGVVFQRDRQVTVVRIDGMIDFKALGLIVRAAIADKIRRPEGKAPLVLAR